MKLPIEFYRQEDPVKIARELLGKVLVTSLGGVLTSGIITETEAYAGITDRASHAYGGRRTNRTATMFRAGGIAYIYLCYGIHHLFNVVTHQAGVPHAVLLRAVYPLEGTEVMELRTGKKFRGKGFSDGPGKLSRALGLNISYDGEELAGDLIYIEDSGFHVPDTAVRQVPRVGVGYAGADALLPYRFLVPEPTGIKKTSL